MTTSNYLKQLIDSDTTIVFTFGYTGVGKTTLLVALYEYLFKYHLVQLNQKGNIEGATFLIQSSGELREKHQLPPITTSLTIKEIDLIYEINKEKTMLTFLDMAGEDLKMVNPREINYFTSHKSTGELDSEIIKYLNQENLPIILLCIIDYERIEKDNELMRTFFNYVETYFPNFSFVSAAIIVTKWDKHDGGSLSSDVISYVRQNANATYLGIKNLVDEPHFFPFSIGKIKEDDNNFVEKLDLSFCKNIIEWLHSISLNNRNSINLNSDETLNDFFEFSFQKVKKILSFLKSFQ